jgi:phenylpyruvate tautomerase PptA (4-oxalocrotonate tautomerase family)
MTQARTSQVVAEVLHKAPSNARTSQLVAEVLHKAPSQARVSQVVVEVLVPNQPVTARPRSMAIWFGLDVG